MSLKEILSYNFHKTEAIEKDQIKTPRPNTKHYCNTGDSSTGSKNTGGKMTELERKR